MIGDVLSHQGGWDEVLFVAIPILLFGLLLIVANRRASRLSKRDDGTGSTPAPLDDRRPRP